MSFTNKIRLPFKITRSQFLKDKSVFRFADGSREVNSVEMSKKYEGETDYLSEIMHQRLAIALEHDTVVIEGEKYFGKVISDGDYEIDWPKFLDYPTGKAVFNVLVTPFDATNSNCKTCEEAQQLNLTDDTFPEILEEGQTYQLNIAANDKICCYPSTFSIVYLNTDYIQDALIDANGVLSITMKATFFTGSNIKLISYRVTCSNDSYDEADVFGNVEGEEPDCNATFNLLISSITTTSAIANFDPAIPVPDHYYWKLYKITDLGDVLKQSGQLGGTEIDLTGLEDDSDYKIFVRSQCDSTNNDSPASVFIETTFHTLEDTTSCGEYILSSYWPFPTPTSFPFSYIDCNGDTKTIILRRNQILHICALQNSPGDPVSITHTSGGSYLHGIDSNCTAPPSAIRLTVAAKAGLVSGLCETSYDVWIAASDIDIHTGVHVFTDSSLSIPFTGYDYITDSGGSIYFYSGNIVGASIGASC